MNPEPPSWSHALFWLLCPSSWASSSKEYSRLNQLWCHLSSLLVKLVFALCVMKDKFNSPSHIDRIVRFLAMCKQKSALHQPMLTRTPPRFLTSGRRRNVLDSFRRQRFSVHWSLWSVSTFQLTLTGRCSSISSHLLRPRRLSLLRCLPFLTSLWTSTE